MFSPIGLEPWEVVAYAGILALGWLGVASTISLALAWVVFGRTETAGHPVVHAEKPASVIHPAAAAREPEFAPPAPTAV